MIERYHPGEAELHTAEAAMLPLQVLATEKRIKVIEKLKGLGVNGVLVTYIHEPDSWTYVRWPEIAGEIGGHEISVNDYPDHINGQIDGCTMSKKDAQAFWQKYRGVAVILSEKDIQDARKELRTLPPQNLEHDHASMLLRGIL